MSLRHTFITAFLSATACSTHGEGALLSNRFSPEARKDARVEAGYPAEAHEAIDRALGFLATQQNQDGSWGDHQKVAMTSLALLAFLGNGVTPVTEEGGELLTNGIIYLISTSQKGKGRLRTLVRNRPSPVWPLEHALATQALAESYMICRDLGLTVPGLEDAAQQAAQWMIDQQHREGGWAYSFSEASNRGPDDWLTVPALHALWLTHRSGLETRNLDRAVRKTLALIEKRQKGDGAVQFPDLANRPGASMTGGCVFAYQIANQASHPTPRKAMRFVVKRAQEGFSYQGETPASDLQYLHYDALALFIHGGKTWDPWHKDRIAELLKHQEQDGSFAPQGRPEPGHPKDAAIKRSSQACLILETPWRYRLK